MFSSVRMDWATPMDFFNALDAEFHFTLDPCASPENAKCKKYYTERQTDYYRAERAKRCFVILLTAVISRRGLSSAGRKRNNREQLS